MRFSPAKCALALAVAMAAAPARGDDADARARAKALAERGDNEFGRGRCDRAIALWKDADAAFHAPTILLRIARCQALMGKVVAAASTLEAIVQDKLPPNAPQPFVDAQRDALDELPGIRERIAELTIRAQGAGTEAVPSIRIDGTPGEAGQLVFRLDPGAHHVRVAVQGSSWEQNVTLDDGERRTLGITVRAEPPPPPSHLQRDVGFALGAVGVASLVTGTLLGVSAATASNHLSGVCGANRQSCPPDEQGTIDRLNGSALAADLTIGGGALLLLSGAIVVLTQPKAKKEPPRIRIDPIGLAARFGGG